MNPISKTLRETRRQRGLSQTALAGRAGISLATLQNLEAGHGNPELKTVQSLLGVLGLEIEIRPIQLNEARWQSYGLPLLTANSKALFAPNRQGFLTEFADLRLDSIDREDDRAKKAWASFLCAIQDHFPSAFRRNANAERWLAAHRESVSPKLRRIALSAMGEFL